MTDAQDRIARLSPQQRERLLERLGRAPDGAAIARPAVLPASFAQQRLWFLAQLDPGAATYHICRRFHLTGALDVAALSASLDELVRRHEVLRSHLAAGVEATQVIAPAFSLLAGVEPATADQLVELSEVEARRPFDLSRGPLVRARLLRLEPQHHALILTLHHAIADGDTLALLQRELIALYRAFAAGRPNPLGEPAPQYADFAITERRAASGEAHTAHLAHWRDRIAGAPAMLALPADHPRPAVGSQRGRACRRGLPAPLAHAIEQLARTQGVSAFAVLFAGFSALLARLTGERDLMIGTVLSTRARAGLEAMAGVVGNMLALRVDAGGQPSFAALVRRAQDCFVDALAHDVPFEAVVEAVRPARELGRSPLLQVGLSMQRGEPARVALTPELELACEAVDNGGAAFDLWLTAEQSDAGLALDAEYATDLFEPATIARWLAGLERLLAGAVGDPTRRISELPIDGDAERRQLRAFVAPAVDPEPAEAVERAFAAQAARTPDAVALEHAGQSVRYAELDRRANQLAHHLRARGAGPDTIVGLSTARGIDCVAGILGILKAGAAYLPLDPAQPEERRAFMIRDAGAHIVLGPEQLEPAALRRLPDHPPPALATADHVAYVMYTSGSTGTAKAAMVTRRGLANHARAGRRYCGPPPHGIKPGDRMLQFSSFAFDASAEEVFPSLTAGATLVLRDDDMLSSPRRFLEACRDLRIDVINLPTAYWQEVVEALARGEAALPPARRFIVGGERVTPDRLRAWLAVPGRPPLVNVYGPTETAVVSTVAVFDDAYAGAQASESPPEPPIGRPIPNVRAYVLDDQLRPSPLGAPGELYIAGDGVGRGYLGRPELTAERYLPDVLGPPGARMYRTGDRGRFRADGQLEFLGRVDRQVKLRGYRVELEEVEAALLRHPAVRDAAVVLRDDGAGPQLVAYVVAATELGELRRYLRERLPGFMVPGAWVAMAALPLTGSDKVDRAALPPPDRTAVEADYAPARDPLHQLVAEIWASVLQRDRVSITDNFFDLGGHSLLATRVIARLAASCGVELPLRALFEAPTVVGLCERIATLRRGSPRSAPRPLAHGAARTLSFTQERLWLFEQLHPGTAVYSLPWVVRIDGPLDPEILRDSLRELVRRHDSLRARFVADGDTHEVRQVIDDACELPFTVVACDPAALAERVNAEVRRPFDLSAGPLVRAIVLRAGETTSVLVVAMHHIVVDGWAIGVLERELLALYDARRRGVPAGLPPVALQCADLASWQRAALHGGGLADELAYWQEQLAGAPHVLALRTDRPRPQVPSFRGAVASRRLGRALRDAVQRCARAHDATPFIVLLAGFQILLARVTGATDLVVGTPVAGRTPVEAEGVVGCFANLLALRCRLAGEPSFAALLARVREQCLDAFAHQELPFERVLDAQKVERSAGIHPLVQVVFAHHPAEPVPRAGELALYPYDVDTGLAKFDLLLATTEGDDGIDVVIEYATDLFDAATIERMLGWFHHLLAGALADPAAPISRLTMLDPAERHQLVVAWNATAAPWDPVCIHTLFERRAAATPAASALRFGATGLSYGELDAAANRLAHHLRARGVGPEVRVAICLPRSLDMVVAVLAVLKAGGAYVPLDPRLPAQRIAMIAEDVAAALLVSHSALRGRVAGDVSGLYLDVEAAEVAARPDSPPAVTVGPAHMAYVIYTSGSTGRPNGVAVAHGGVVNVVAQAIETLGLTAADRVLQVASLGFDASVLELFATLAVGAELVLAEADTVRSGLALGRLIEDAGVTALLAVNPMMLELVPEAAAPRLRIVMVGGEATPAALVGPWATGHLLVNIYGPTEASIYATSYACPEGASAAMPLGRPIRNVRIYVLDRELSPVPVGVIGEIFLGGAGLARCYHDRPALTAARFVPDPFGDEPGARLYRTGDLGWLRGDGMLEFVGRIDHQIKLRGHRIDLGEVEAALLDYADVRQAAVVLRRDGDASYLAAYVAPEVAPAELRAHLGARLPPYMMPAAIIGLPALPLNASGKLDRGALPPPDRGAAPDDAPRPAPRNAVEQAVLDSWAQVLGLSSEQLGMDDNFFQLGGNSLLATRVVSQLRARYGVELPLRALFDAPDLAALAEALINEGLKSSGDPP